MEHLVARKNRSFSLSAWLRREREETAVLLRCIPATAVTLFVVSVVCMNLTCSPTRRWLQTQWLALDGRHTRLLAVLFVHGRHHQALRPPRLQPRGGAGGGGEPAHLPDLLHRQHHPLKRRGLHGPSTASSAARGSSFWAARWPSSPRRRSTTSSTGRLARPSAKTRTAGPPSPRAPISPRSSASSRTTSSFPSSSLCSSRPSSGTASTGRFCSAPCAR